LLLALTGTVILGSKSHGTQSYFLCYGFGSCQNSSRLTDKLLLALTSIVILGSESRGVLMTIFLLSDGSRSLHNPISTPYRNWPLLYSRIENTAPDGSPIVTCVFVAAEMSLSCHCLATAIFSCSTIPAFNRHVNTMVLHHPFMFLTYPYMNFTPRMDEGKAEGPSLH
jgi:hypothetical protein